jgi:glycosyltransferase involved in cell wall biosynthesis
VNAAVRDPAPRSCDRIKIFQVITRMVVGGAQETVLHTAAHLDPQRFSCSIVTGPETGPEGDLSIEARERGADLLVVRSLVRRISPLRDVKAFFALRDLFVTERPEVVHTHSSKAGIIGRAAAYAAGVPTIVHTVHGWSFHGEMSGLTRALYVALEKWAGRVTHRIVVVAAKDISKGVRRGIGREATYCVIPSGIPLDERSAEGAREATRAELRIPRSAPVVGTVARLSHQKDPFTTLRAMQRIAQARAEAHFVVVGDGELMDECKKLVSDLGLRNLHLLGLRRDTERLLPAFDVYVLTSKWEGLPRTIPEAMASGVPVVATNVDGNAEVIRHRENGFLVEVGDPDAVAKAALTLLEDAHLYASISAAGRTTAKEFALEIMVERLTELYELELKASASRRRR